MNAIPSRSDRLSWADTAASTFGRLWGRYTPPLPSHILGLPLAPRKSLAGFIAAAVTGAAIVFSFWTWMGEGVDVPSWSWEQGVIGAGVDDSIVGSTTRGWLREQGFAGVKTGGWVGLAVVSIASGLATAVAESMGASNHFLRLNPAHQFLGLYLLQILGRWTIT